MKNRKNTGKPDTLKKIEEAIRRFDAIDGLERAELLGLLEALKAEVGRLSATHAEHAHSIAGFAQVAAHEAAREQKSPHLLKHSVDGLSLSVKGFEASHPRLVEIVNELCVMLAQIGV